MIEGEGQHRVDGRRHVALARVVAADPVADRSHLCDAAPHIGDCEGAEERLILGAKDEEWIGCVILNVVQISLDTAPECPSRHIVRRPRRLPWRKEGAAFDPERRPGVIISHLRDSQANPPAGESRLHHARSVLYSLEKMQGELSEYADGVRGHVRVHANISAIVQFLPEDLGAFRRAHEAIKIDLEEHLSSEVLRAVQEGASDLGICNVADGETELQALPYRRDHLVLIVPAGA